MSGDKKSGKIYPHVWKYGPDELKHEIHQGYLKAKAQADFRKEQWLFTFEDFYQMWRKDWYNRGRAPDNMCMTRHDFDGPWSRDNSYIVTRKEHLAEQGRRRAGKNMRYKPRYSKLKVEK